MVRYAQSNAGAVIGYAVPNTRWVSVNVLDQRGSRIATIANGVFPAGRHEAYWDARRVPAGVYVCTVEMDGREAWAGKIVVGK
jgi:hypothetical protein